MYEVRTPNRKLTKEEIIDLIDRLPKDIKFYIYENPVYLSKEEKFGQYVRIYSEDFGGDSVL